MDVASIALFCLAVVVGTATPGPTVVTLFARVLALGRRGNLAFSAGLVIGDILWLACAVFGVAAVAAVAHEVMLALKYLGAAYLLFLAYKLWTAPTGLNGDLPTVQPSRPLRAAAGGMAVAIANPKTMMFYLALIPNLVDVGQIDAVVFLELSVLVTIIYSGVLAGYTMGAVRARRLLSSDRARRAINRGSSVVLVGTAGVVASRA